MSSEDRFEAVIDFKVLPIVEAVSMLRSLGGYLLACTLAGVQPQLKDRITPEMVRLLVTSSGSLPWSLGRLLHRDRRFPFPDTVEQRVNGKLSPHVYLARVGDELEHQFERTRGYRFPRDFWALLGEYAWGDLEFQHDTAESLERELRKRTLFSADLRSDSNHEARSRHFPTMTLSTGLFWLLLTMAVSSVQFNWTYRFLPSRRRNGKAFMLLQKEGLRQGLRPSWANAWDQWVLLEAVRRWKVSQIPDPLKQAINILPLAAFRVGQAPEFAMIDSNCAPDEVETPQPLPDEPVKIALREWHEGIPGWFGEWNQLRS